MIRMSRLSGLALVLLGSAALAACSTIAPSTEAGLRASQSTDSIAPGVAPAQGSTAYGLYLAGEAAIDGGSSREAASYFSEASQLDPGFTTVQARAFSASLVAGEVSRAAEAAKGLGQGDEPVQQLGLLTQAVEALATDHAKQAYLLISEPSVGVQHAEAIRLVKPWLAAAAGDWLVATAPPPPMADPVASGVAELGRAELLERDGKFADAEAIMKPKAGGKNGLFTLGYGGFLERRGRKGEAPALYDKAAQANPGDAGIHFAKERVAAGRPPVELPNFRQGAAEALIAPAAMLGAKRGCSSATR
jgi:tetratricopeptide (TPR) repeat protein